MGKVWVEINLRPHVRYDCHWADFYGIQADSTTFCLYWISWKPDKRLVADTREWTEGRGLHIRRSSFFLSQRMPKAETHSYCSSASLNSFKIIMEIWLNMPRNSIFQYCSVITVTTNIYIFDTSGYRFQFYRAIIRPIQQLWKSNSMRFVKGIT